MHTFAHKSGHKLARDMMQILRHFWTWVLLGWGTTQHQRSEQNAGATGGALDEWQWGCDGKHMQNMPTPAHGTRSHMKHAYMCVDIRMLWISLGIYHSNWLIFNSWPCNQFEIRAFLLTRWTDVTAGCSQVTVHCVLCAVYCGVIAEGISRINAFVFMNGKLWWVVVRRRSACRPAASKHKLAKS